VAERLAPIETQVAESEKGRCSLGTSWNLRSDALLNEIREGQKKLGL